MFLSILKSVGKFIWNYKFWILLVIFVSTLGLIRYFHQKNVLELQAVIAKDSSDLQFVQRQLDLCDLNFKTLSAKCKASCPGMASDINQIEKDYQLAKKEIQNQQAKTQELLDQIKKLQEEQNSGKISWAGDPKELEDQLRKLLGDKWQTILDRLKQGSGLSGPISTLKKFHYYPKMKLGIGTDLNQIQGQVGVSFFSYGRERSIEKTVLDFAEPFVAIGMNSDGKVDVGLGLIPVSLNLGGILPVVKDLDVFAGAQFNIREQKFAPSLGISSTF